MTQRRLRSLVGTLVGLFAIILIQRFQLLSEHPLNAVSSPIPSRSTSSVPFLEQDPIFISTSTRFIANAQVVRVVDGDTLIVRRQGQLRDEKVRMIGINTPESVDPRRIVECFGKEASTVLRTWLDGKEVYLAEDVQADERDKYHRLLRNVFLPEGTDVNATLVAQGYAQAYTNFPMNKSRKQQLVRLQQEAKTRQRGLWNPDVCNGKKRR